MRRLLTWLLVTIMLVPMAVSCYPSGYDKENPGRPPGHDKEEKLPPPEGAGTAETSGETGGN
ncbi:MAG: hypothetical protein ABIC40_04005 [bacterium]